MRAIVVAWIVLLAVVAHADPDPKRKVVVLEYRAGSSALSGISGRIVAALTKQTSLQVLGPDQTRALYGEHLDSAIVKCGGDADCIARIGQRVGAAEVILVGVSELGDVILTMQRIDVSSHAVVSRIADSLASGAIPTDKQVSDYLGRLLPASDFLRFGIIDIISSQADAVVTIGGQKHGTTPIQPLKLHAPATYVIRIEKEGFSPFTTKVQLPPDSELKVEAELSRRGGTSWWQHWYVMTAAAVIVAGAAGTTIYFATQKTSDRVPVSGTIN